MINKFKYKAYISYSHRDEQAGAWLHRALEAYRVPRKLVGTKTVVGEVPARIRPVFRDRDDFSSASDLSDTVKHTLTDSENLIVLCSPASAASHWVNEEIREFASLGRKKQIFCVIVDGESAPDGSVSAIFPAALAEAGLQEPLAADIRKWADGKHLSKLKLVAGMLGLPLDQLRRRDLQKRQKIWTLAAVASVALAAVLITAVTARIAAQQRRDSGESLVAYKLNELRTMLNVADDPAGLTRLSQWNPNELDRLISEVGMEKDGLTVSAMELREQGIEFWRNGELGMAMDKFQSSWALLAETYRRDDSNHMAYFELGQAEYWIGQTYMDLGSVDAAEDSFISYAEITRQLIQLQPENAEWVLEMAYALTNLGSLQQSRDANRPERALQFMQSALEYNQIALVLDPANDYYRSELGQSHAFLADAQLDVCDLEGALKSRKEHVELESGLMKAEPDNADRVHDMALALTGIATVKEFQGNIDDVMASLREALRLLNENLSRNVDIRHTTVLILERQRRLARMMALSGDTQEAWELSNIVSDNWQGLGEISREDIRVTLSYIDFLLDRAWLARVNGHPEIAEQLLLDTQQRLLAIQINMSFKRRAGIMLVDTAFQHWEMTNELPPADVISRLPEYEAEGIGARACRDASRAVIKAVMLGQMAQAREFTDYLLQNNYHELSFIRVCKKYSLCPGQ